MTVSPLFSGFLSVYPLLPFNFCFMNVISVFLVHRFS